MLSVATVHMHVEEALNGLFVDLFLQCSSDENLAAALETTCNEHGIHSDHCYQKWKLVNLFQKLKQRRIVSDDNIDFLKQFAEAEQREDIKKRIEELEEEKWSFPGNYKTKRSRGITFRWPATLNYGSNALSQILLGLVQDKEHMTNREKAAFYIYCDGLVKPQLDFSDYMSDPFLLIQKLMDRELIGPRNLDLLKRFFSLETVRKPKEIAILEHFEAGAFVKDVLATYSGYSPDFTDEPADEPLKIPWMETARLIKKLTKKSFKGTGRLHFIRDLLQYIQQMESGEYRLHKMLNHLIEDVLLAEDNEHSEHWQLFLKLLVVSGELCCLTDPLCQPCHEIADISRAIGVRSPLDPKIILQTDDFKSFLKEKEVLLYRSSVETDLEREAMDKMILTAWQKYKESKEKDEEDDIELLNIFFDGILLFHWKLLRTLTTFTTQRLAVCSRNLIRDRDRQN